MAEPTQVHRHFKELLKCLKQPKIGIGICVESRRLKLDHEV